MSRIRYRHLLAVAASAGVLSVLLATMPGSAIGLTTYKSRAAAVTFEIYLVPFYGEQPPDAASVTQMQDTARQVAAYYTDQLAPDARMVLKATTQPLNLSAYRGSCPMVDAVRAKALKMIGAAASRGHVLVAMAAAGSEGFRCNSGALGDLGGPGGQGVQVSWVLGTSFHLGKPSPLVQLHEIGHNLGLGHAVSSICSSDSGYVSLGGSCAGGFCPTGMATPTSSSCNTYGDPYSIMGGAHRAANLTVQERIKLGLTRDTAVTTVLDSRQIRLSRIGSPTDDPRAAYLPWTYSQEQGAAGLSLTYQAASGYSSWLADNPLLTAAGVRAATTGAGVVVTMHGDNAFGFAGVVNTHPELYGDFGYSPAMAVGETWSTPDGAISVHVDAIDAENADLTIQRAVGDSRPPWVEESHIKPSGKSRGALREVWVDWTVRDDTGIAAQSVTYRGKEYPVDLSNHFEAAAGAYGRRSIWVQAGRQSFTINVTDLAGHRTLKTVTRPIR